MSEYPKLVIIGAGFGGIGCALYSRQLNHDARIILLEKQSTLLSWTQRKGLAGYPLCTLDPLPIKPATGHGDWSVMDSMLQAWHPDDLLGWLGDDYKDQLEAQAGSLVHGNPACLADLFEQHLKRNRIELETGFVVESISVQGENGFRIWGQDGRAHQADRLVMATGCEHNHAFRIAQELGASIVPPVAGFVRLKLASRQYAERIGPIERPVGIRIPKSGATARGVLKLSARGLEGPALSSLCATACREWQCLDYTFPLEIDWLPAMKPAELISHLLERKLHGGKRMMVETPMFSFPQRSWSMLLKSSRIDGETTWSRVKEKHLQSLAHRLKSDRINASGMGLPEGERAWAGGVEFKCLDQGKLELKSQPGLFFAGEMLDFIGQPGGQHQNLVWASSAAVARAAFRHS